MKKFTSLLAVAAAAFTFVGAPSAQAAVVDTIEAPTGNFLPGGVSPTNSAYWLGNGEDWGWQHNPIAAGFTSAKLNISAYDVDEAPCGLSLCEVDNIEAYDADTGMWVLLGALTGDDNAFSFTEFDIYAASSGALIDDIEDGLQVRIIIDVLNNGWLVTLAKSVITTDGAGPGNPNPGVIPLPAAGWLMLAGLGGLAAMRRRRDKA